MNYYMRDGEITAVSLQPLDTLQEMASVSGCTMDRLRIQIENIINKSIHEESNRLKKSGQSGCTAYKDGEA